MHTEFFELNIFASDSKLVPVDTNRGGWWKASVASVEDGYIQRGGQTV